jgi:hypothetical protein
LEKSPRKPANPDIELTAGVKAKELRFDHVPDTKVDPPAQTERENLPEQVRPEHAGTTFRNVSIDVRIADDLNINYPSGWEVVKETQTGGTERVRNPDMPGQATDTRDQATQEEKR